MLELSERQTVIIAILVLFLGKLLNKHIKPLQEYNIPEPVTGGVLVSLLLGLIYFSANIEVRFQLDFRDAMLIVFFSTIGLSSRLITLLQGGKSLALLLVMAIGYLFIQNLTGLAISQVTALPSAVGVLGGSIALSGGHGTAIAWAPSFVSDYAVHNAMEIGIACATFGLVLGGIIGGPIAKHLINKHKLDAYQPQNITVGVTDKSSNRAIDVDSILISILVITITTGLGIQLDQFIASFGLQLPTFVSCLFVGILLTNTVPYALKNIDWPTGSPSLALISDLSLSLFLAMSLMGLQLWTLIDLAGPILLLLVAQVLVAAGYVIFVVFNVLGRDYNAAVAASGYAGLVMGATPTAIANMTAVTKKYGAAPKAFIIVPLVGAFFIDITNAIIIKFFLNLL
ncbi:sodium/glutamate symporter [Marinagarivorans cellulosilyticus]|uniref:Sodium/glutamate symporter n=1 Tax=Marinagarivorans cellulosilyticus TaxID=2721545 RepID=A0AAN1WF74_9GAMM|nr:sodium/glutamate symporter [Marinagarivorans cellulosilyticus]BCD96503.1 glutamate:Na+ symporter, ESS family [Marinagarivorans cellulosilyticus]